MNSYLKVNLYEKNNKKYIKNYSLYINGKLLKTIDPETSKKITKAKKEKHIKYEKINNEYIISDISFIKEYVKTPAKKVSRVQSNVGKIAIITGLALAYLSSSLDNNQQKPITEIQITAEDLDEFNEEDNYVINKVNDTPNYLNENIVEQSITYNSFEENNDNVVQFEAEDESLYYLIETILEKYNKEINNAAIKYKLDPYLIAGIISGENPDYKENYSGYAGTGLMCVEAQIWDGFELVEGEPIDCNRMNSDPGYSIDVGCSIFRYYYDKIVALNNQNYYNYKLSNTDCFKLALFCYNKGESFIYETAECNNIDEMFDYIKSVPIGCDYYIEHILSKFQDGTIINLTDYNNQDLQLKIENLSLKKERTF